MYNGHNLLEVSNTTVNIFARNVARILWNNNEFATYRFEGYENKVTDRVNFDRKEDLDKIDLLKSISFFIDILFITFN